MSDAVYKRRSDNWFRSEGKHGYIYRERFRPSAQLAAPRVMLGVNVVAADTDEEARFLFSSTQQSFLNIRRGRPGRLPPPVEDMDSRIDPYGRAMLDDALACAVYGSPETVRRGLDAFAERTGAFVISIDRT